MSQVERSLVLVKPDGYSRGLTGEVLRRIEAKGYKLVDLKIVNATEEILSSMSPSLSTRAWLSS